MLHQIYKEQQEKETRAALELHFANRDKPKAIVPVDTEYLNLSRAFEKQRSLEIAAERAALEAVFAKRNALRATKIK